MKRLPAETGISVVSEPGDSPPVIDVVFIHGLQGHPHKTWSNTNANKVHQLPPPSPQKPTKDDNASNRAAHARGGPRGWTSTLTKMLRGGSVHSEAMRSGDGTQANAADGKSSSVFWPADLLPSLCPRARILVFGYDTKITKYMSAATNKNSIYSHAKDLLFGLSREAVLKRPLIFVAHSLGGIVLKEMLARSSSSTERLLANIVESTVAIVFLGTPHRGSPDFAPVGEWARSVIGALGIETTPTVLDSLGLRNADLERAQEAFSALWTKHDFRVKTFQEGLGLTRFRLGVLGSKVVPDYSSSLGDQRERAETIQADHRDMCRFTGPDDPGYRQVSGEILSIYNAIAKSVEQTETEQPVYPKKQSRVLVASKWTERFEPARQTEHGGSVPIPSTISLDLQSNNVLTEPEIACLQSLWFPAMHLHRRSIKDPVRHTCNWLFERKLYADWFSGRNREKNQGLLYLRGKPGAGKSVLMKEAYRRTIQTQIRDGDYVAAFFFNSEGGDLEHSVIGAFRTLLYQLLSQDRPRLTRVAQRFHTSTRFRAVGGDESSPANASWGKQELEKALRDLLIDPLRKRKVFIFIDALDECDPEEAREHAYFWRSITEHAYAESAELNVLLSARDFPFVTLSRCPNVWVNLLNEAGITKYVEQRFRLGLAAKEPDWQRVRTAIVGKASGVFLWVVLVVDEVIERWERGDSLLALLKHLDVLPRELSDLFQQLLESVPWTQQQRTLHLFYWAVLSVRPLRLHEWHHVLAFIQRPPPTSLAQWRASEYYTKDADQLERQIRTLSRGLLEVTTSIEESGEDNGELSISAHVFAGSLDQEHGDTRVVQVIHESVRQYFQDRGFRVLSGVWLDLSPDLSFSRGHISILTTCLDYLRIRELDALATARIEATKRKTRSVSKLSLDMVRDDLQMGEDAAINSHDQAPFGTQELDIMRWMAGVSQTPLAPGHGALLMAPDASSTSELSVSFSSEVLEDYPALLFYATQEFLTHFSLAATYPVPACAISDTEAVAFDKSAMVDDAKEERKRDSTRRALLELLGTIVNRLSDLWTWKRLVALGEDMLDTAELARLILSKGISPDSPGQLWIDRARPADHCPSSPRSPSSRPTSPHRASPPSKSWGLDAFLEMPRQGRSGMIGSFCSAASISSSQSSAEARVAGITRLSLGGTPACLRAKLADRMKGDK